MILLRQPFQKVQFTGRGTGSKLDGVDAGAVVKAADAGKIRRRENGIIGICEKEDDVRLESQGKLQGLHVLGPAVRQNAADEGLSPFLSRIVGELHSRRLAWVELHDVRTLVVKN